MTGSRGVQSKALLTCVLILSVGLRICVALYFGDIVDAPPLMTDQRSYATLGERILTGHGYSFDTWWYPATPPGSPTAFWSFLYPLFIAAVYRLFGVHPLAARLVQAVLGGILLPWMVHRLTRRLFPERDGLALLAAGLAACYGYFALYAATLMTETFYIVLVLWSLEVALRLRGGWRAGERAPWVWGAELGLSLGLAALMRQSILPWAPILFLALLWGRRSDVRTFQRLHVLIVGGLVLLACILPWTIRNYRVYGEFLLLNSNTGYAMYSAQHPMHGTSFREFDAAPIPDELRGLNEAQMDRALLRRGVQFIVDDPGRYALLSLSRLRALFEFWPTRDTTLLHNLGRTGSFGLYLPFMLYGLVLLLRDSQLFRAYGLVLLFMLCYAALHILTWAMVRYRLPVDAAAMPLAALAADDLYRRARGRWQSSRSRGT